MGNGRDKARIAQRIEGLLERIRDGRDGLIGSDAQKKRYGKLAAWQSARLAWTHGDLLESPRYGKAATFFLSDLYGSADYGARDEAFARVAGIMARVMPASALSPIAYGLEVHAITQELDAAMIELLFGELSVRGRIRAHQYGEAYRLCDNQSDRLRQLALVSRVGRNLDKVVHRNSVYHLVRLAHGPAHLAGFGDLQDFVERGFEAFRHMKGADEFLDTVTAREMAIHRAIMESAPPAEWAPAEII